MFSVALLFGNAVTQRLGCGCAGCGRNVAKGAGRDGTTYRTVSGRSPVLKSEMPRSGRGRHLMNDRMVYLRVRTLDGAGHGASGEGGGARARVRCVCLGGFSRRLEGARTRRGVVYQVRRGRVAASDVHPRGCLEEGKGMAAPDYPAAAVWYRYGLADNACHVVIHICRPSFLELIDIL